MSKYFITEDEPLISSYQDGEYDERIRKTIDRLKDLVSDDIALPMSIIEAYADYYQSYGGRYDVRKYGLVAEGLCKFYKRFPHISKEAFKEIADRYIMDLFEDYDLESCFEKIIKVYGETDEAFELFITYVDKKADELDKKYEIEASKLDDYMEEYYIEGRADFYQFIPYLKRLVTGEHVHTDKIIDSLPSPEIVKKDALQLSELSRFYRCELGSGYPTSFFYTRVLSYGLRLLEVDEKIKYYVSSYQKEIEGTFSTREFMDSVRERKEKRLGKK